MKRDIDLYINAMEADLSANVTCSESDGTFRSSDIGGMSPIDEMYKIDEHERIGEYIMLRLRLAAGISSDEFSSRFGRNFDALYGRKLKVYIDNGFMSYNNGRYFFTPKGMYVSNYILSNILDFDEDSRIVGGIADGSDKA